MSIESLRAVSGPLPDRNTELLDVVTELFKQRTSKALLEHLIVQVRRSLSATFAAVVDRDSSDLVASDGQLPDNGRINALALQAMSPPPYAVEGDGDHDVATAHMVQADLILVVGRIDPVLRDRERQWLSIMAEIADHGWRDRT